MIKLEKVSKYYSGQGSVAMGLHSVSCELKENEIIAIVGESGSGKSTFLRVIGGIDTYEDGELYFNNEPTSHFIAEDFEKFRRDNVGFIFQDYNLIDSYTVLQNVMLPIMLRGVDSKTAKEEAKIIIEKVGLKNRVNHKSTKLSGGEKQRTVIARALASDTKILACDEPTGNLDSKTSKEIIELIKEVSKDKLVLIVTHNYDEVKEVATRRIKFHDGEIVEDVELKNTLKEEHQIEEKPAYNLKKKDLLKISFRNLLATPKKTILSLLILLSICFFITIIYQAIYDSSQDVYPTLNYYYNLDPNRVVAYSTIDEPLDTEAIKQEFSNEIVTDITLIEDRIFSISFQSEDSYVYGLEEAAILIYHIPNNTEIYGNMPTENNEIVVGITKYSIYEHLNLIGSNVRAGSFTFTITGYFYINHIVATRFLIYGTKSLNDTLFEEYANTYALVSEALGVYSPEVRYDFSLNDPNAIYVTYKKNEKSIAEEIVKHKKMILKTRDGALAIELMNVNFIYIENQYAQTGTMYIGSIKTKAELLKNNTRSVSIYSSNPDDVLKRLNQMGISAHMPIRVNSMSIDRIVNQILFIIVSIISTIAVLFVIGFTYFLLSKVYITKNKDYTIMRTLGINKYMMSKIVKYEVLGLTLIASFLVVIIILLGYNFTDSNIFKVFNTFHVIPFIVIFLIILLLSLRIAKMFNKRLFKFSVNSSLRMEELNHD